MNREIDQQPGQNTEKQPGAIKKVITQTMDALAERLNTDATSYYVRTDSNSRYNRYFVGPVQRATEGHIRRSGSSKNIALSITDDNSADLDTFRQEIFNSLNTRADNLVKEQITPAQRELGKTYANIAQELNDQSDQKATEWERLNGEDSQLATESDVLKKKADKVGGWAKRLNPDSNHPTPLENRVQLDPLSIEDIDLKQDLNIEPNILQSSDTLLIDLPEPTPDTRSKEHDTDIQPDTDASTQADPQELSDTDVHTEPEAIQQVISPTEDQSKPQIEEASNIPTRDTEDEPQDELPQNLNLSKKAYTIRIIGDERPINGGSVIDDSRALFRGRIFEEEAQAYEQLYKRSGGKIKEKIRKTSTNQDNSRIKRNIFKEFKTKVEQLTRTIRKRIKIPNMRPVESKIRNIFMKDLHAIEEFYKITCDTFREFFIYIRKV